MKNIKWLLFLLLPILGFSQSGGKNFIDQNYIEVIGKSKIELIPNRIHILIELKENSSKYPIEEQEENLIQVLTEEGVDIENDIFINDFLINYKVYLLRKNDLIKSKEYEVIIHDNQKLTVIFSKLEEADITNVKIVKTTHSDLENIVEQVQQEAILNAKLKAEKLLIPLEINLGKGIYIKELRTSDNNRLRNQLAGTAKGLKIRGLASLEQNEYQLDFDKMYIEKEMLVRFAIGN